MRTTIRLKRLLLVIAIFATTCPGQKDITVSTKTVLTIAGDGVAGYSAKQINNPYGLVIGPDDALYFCDLDNQRIRRLDLKSRELTTIAGSGQKGYAGDGGPALQASLNMPHELRFDPAGDLFIVERDKSHHSCNQPPDQRHYHSCRNRCSGIQRRRRIGDQSAIAITTQHCL